MNKLLRLSLCAGLFAAAHSHAAGLDNGHFNNGLAGWQTLGDVSVQGGSAFLTNASLDYDDDFPAPAGAYNFSGTSAAGVGAPSDVEDFSGLLPGGLDPDIDNGIAAYEGSALKQTFSVNAGDTLSFNWQFLTNEGGKNDYAFIIVDDVFSRLADVSWATAAAPVFALASALGEYTYQFLSSGEHTVVFGVVDVEDYGVSSALSIDNVQIAAVPEPEQYALFLAGLGLLGAAVRRRT